MANPSKKKLDKQVKKLRSKISRHFRESPKEVLNHKQLASRLGIKDSVEKQILIAVIEALIKDGLLGEEQRGKFRWLGAVDDLEGIIAFNRAGNAFVEVHGFNKDIMIPEKYTGVAFHGDLVALRLLTGKGSSGRPKGKVTSILERARVSFPAILFRYNKNFFAIPDNPKITVDFFVREEDLNGGKEGEKVVVSLEEWDDPTSNPRGAVTDVLGMPGDMKAEGDAILAEFGFPLKFPDKVEEACAKISESISEEEVGRRRDFREILTFTIDPADAKDFDDAISFQRLENGHFEIGVHIADVTHYVTENSVIEEEAQNRATSVYLVDRVIPMLPEKLSNKVCSLRPKEEKLCFSAVFEMNEKAQILDNWLGKTVIYSDHRFEYDDVQTILDQGEGLYSDDLKIINNIARTLRSSRLEKGSIAFEKEEVKFLLDEKSKPTDVFFKVQKDAHKLIEEFMLLANRTVAAKVGKKGSDGSTTKTYVYRVHDNPDPTKLKELNEFVRRFGYSVDLSTPEKIASSINALLKSIKNTPEQHILEMLAIRSMSKAEYSVDNVGHFGLAFPFYSHFTSPIRRYPDMIAHRLLFSYLNGGSSASEEPIERLCKHSGVMERKAVEAERESTKLYQVLFMQDQVGEVFDGVISGVAEWGVFVELVANKCEGLIRLRDIDGDYFYYDQKSLSIIGQRTKKSYELGESVAVKIIAADIENRRIDLKLV
ncbi:MAG: ribonuclease R [Flavobacteriales bacterium]|nr:ribonuclease R [Flavobacteriales bacterium]MBT4706115.1 ribonuclease R [Flavobacteriales bacterium]MBT4930638.1 ribonuclease R [Flavobacteriales bacterium]MBT6381918.1 ribonuclease R [Flavobacteriales bacterium]MBT6916600.1 ribonuclease R [Flavobacteriales bacterium]